MSTTFLNKIKDDIYSDIIFLKKAYNTICIDDLKDIKISGLANRFTVKLSMIEEYLNNEVPKLIKYLFYIEKNKQAYKELYTRILFKLRSIKQIIYIFHIIYGLVTLREKAKKKVSRRYLSLADEYIDLMSKEMGFPKNLLFILTPGNSYATIPILEEKISVIMLPFTNLTKPWKWVLLSHELGHIYFRYSRKNIIMKTLPIIEEKLRESIYEKEGIKNYIKLWSRYWLEEIVSDIIATGLCGPAFLKMLILEAIEHDPTHVHASHPPLDIRALAQIEYMCLVKAPNKLIQTMKNAWKKFRSGVKEASSLPEYMNEELVKRILPPLADIIPRPFIVSNWDKFERIIYNFPKIKDEDIRFIILAMALSDIHKEL
ncbi:MAG: hypothetical protein LWW95_11190 [Candidatus Desulfofervidus auxilii]|nr:hypothetical protein [Candidatus Desulfofervidus auxilii]